MLMKNCSIDSSTPTSRRSAAIARGTLEASTMGGRLAASLEAWTYLDSSGRFGFEVIHEEGSALIREHVLLKALQTEQRSHNERAADNAHLSPANYEFQIRSDTG